ncbi:unnamed protein product [Cuscuta campestris]|uniref:Uncharacterized protein n=1 Tax=Cuscuta campestris TaxID=132261 RepID=A0A484L4R8_9ASTE|nr:unnamed protein product [Cuscuta campestris]
MPSPDEATSLISDLLTPDRSFPFALNAWGKRMKVQVKPRETDDLAAWEATLWTWDTSNRGPYNVGKWGVYPGRETGPEPEIILAEAFLDVIPLRRMKGSKAPVFAAAGSSRRVKKKEKVVKFNSTFATPRIEDVEEPSTAQPFSQPSSQPLILDKQPAQSQQGTSQPIHSGDIYINVDTLEFDNMLMETGHTSEAGQVDRIGQEWFTRLVKSKDVEKARLEGMMVACRKDAQAAHQKAEKAEEKLMEHCAAFRKLYAKHEGLLKASKEADAQAQEKIQELEGEKAELKEKAAQSAEEIAQLSAELEKEHAERASLAAAWAAQEPSAKVIDEIGTFGFESGQYEERRALYDILQRRIQSFEPKALSLPELHDEAPVAPFEVI